MMYIINEKTDKVHKQGTRESEFSTACGVTYQMDRERMDMSVTESLSSSDKCGRCFEDGGGY